MISMLKVSQPMQKAIDTFLDKTKDKSCLYNLDATFTSSIVPELKVRLSPEILNLTIEQDFIENYTDKITMELELDKDSYITLYHMRKDLNVKLEVSQINTAQNYERLPEALKKVLYSEKFEFKCIITHYEDIFKKLPKDRIYPQLTDESQGEDARDRPTLKMTLELLPKEIFKARKIQFNAIFNLTTMEDLLRYTANFYGFDSAFIIKPDNEWKYLNLVIPPAYGIEQIVEYLQQSPGLGIYNNGCNHYITRYWEKPSQMTWFLYPRFGIPTVANPIHVYDMGLNNYDGLTCNHWVDEGNCINIFFPGRANIKNWSDLGSENHMTAANVQLTDLVLDDSRKLNADNNISANKTTMNLAIVPTDPMDKNDYVKINHIKSKGNLFAIRSALGAYQGTNIEFTWQSAVPWTFTPGTEVQYHWEDHQGFQTLKGMCEGVTYSFSRDKTNSALMPVCVCNATVKLNFNNVQE